MLVAQLNNKVPREFEGLEDVLTSSVFALLRYLPRSLASYLLTKWADIPLQPDAPAIDFWPQCPTPPGFGIFLGTPRQDEIPDRGETKPDVVIRTDEWLIVVEVKYRSHLDPAYDQLGREFAVGHRLAKENDCRFRLLVVTADVLAPQPDGVDLVTGTQRALEEVHDTGGDVTEEMIASVPSALRWISWQRVYKSLSRTSARPDASAHHRRFLGDTSALLELRGLRPYSVRPLVRAIERRDCAAIPDDAWRSPMPYHYQYAQSSLRR